MKRPSKITQVCGDLRLLARCMPACRLQPGGVRAVGTSGEVVEVRQTPDMDKLRAGLQVRTEECRGAGGNRKQCQSGGGGAIATGGAYEVLGVAEHY
jgi:hypothetical protein